MIQSPALEISAVGQTDRGRVRSQNQDYYGIYTLHGTFVGIVADGMGGHEGGEIASKMAVEAIAESLDKDLTQYVVDAPAVAEQIFVQAVRKACESIFDKALDQPQLRGMGTTVTAIAIQGENAFVAQVGDSRLYLHRCDMLYQITEDHSLVQEQVRTGRLSEEDALTHRLRNVITRSVGYQELEDVDFFNLKIRRGDRFLISSDGLHGKVSDDELAYYLRTEGLASLPDSLIQAANNAGGEDNITVIIADIE